MFRSLLRASAITVTFYLSASATLLPYPSPLPSVSTNYDTILLNTWQGIKRRMVDPYEIPLVHRPRSEDPHDAVSEGVGYGMLLALFCNDQIYFDKIWDAGERYMWDDNGMCYNWRVSRDGNVIGMGAASDAEQDIALALIFADGLVTKGVWSAHQSPKGVDYATRAQSIINSMWINLVEEGRYLRPGTQWGGRSFVNPGYFAPAFYRVFDEFEAEDHNWTGVIDQCYRIITVAPGYELGLIPDWMQPDGNYAGGDQLGYNAYAEGKFMYKDAIRTLWRMATDCLWYNDPRAKEYCDNACNFIQTPDRANFFQMDGSAVTDSFILGNNVVRPRSEHSAMTIGMWATAVMAAGGPEAANPFSDELLNHYTPGEDYWGKASDPDGEDTLHNEMYFEQFLAWFGASLISGIFTDLWDDLKDSTPEIPVAFDGSPVVEPQDIDANIEPLRINARFSKTVRWSVAIKHRDSSNATVGFSGRGEGCDVQWGGTSHDGKTMPQGAYRVTISARGMPTPFTKMVWLGRAIDLKSGDRLMVDDFSDGDLRPNFGVSWGSYTEQSDGKNGTTTIREMTVIDDNGLKFLKWSFMLNGSQNIGFDPYAALEWNGQVGDTTFTLIGLDTLIFVARSASELNVSVQLITSNIGDYTFFEDSIMLSTEFKEYCLPVAEFRQRLNGSGAELDLSKCTAIRFQVQGPDSTRNEIFLDKLLFAGDMLSLYSSPPDYIPPEPDIGVQNVVRKHYEKFSVLQMAETVLFNLPTPLQHGLLTVVSIDGRIVARRNFVYTQQLSWDYTDGNGATVTPGCYIAVLGSAGGEHRVPLLYVR